MSQRRVQLPATVRVQSMRGEQAPRFVPLLLKKSALHVSTHHRDCLLIVTSSICESTSAFTASCFVVVLYMGVIVRSPSSWIVPYNTGNSSPKTAGAPVGPVAPVAPVAPWGPVAP